MKLKWAVFVLGILAFEVLFLSLGHWQYNRMHEKEAEKQAFLESIPERTKVMRGVFDHSREVVLESQRYENMYGYRILTPLVMGSKEIIVDRGWIQRSFEPDFLMPFQADGTHTVEGVLRDVPTRKQTSFLGSEFGSNQGATVLQLLILENIPPKDGIERVEDVYLQATKPTAAYMKAFMVPPIGGEKHKEYMLTWWAMALIMPVLAFVFWRQSKRKD